MKEQDETDHLFKSAFDDFAVAPPASVKESIDLFVARKRRKKIFGWFFLGLIVFVLLFIAGITQLQISKMENRASGTTVDNESHSNKKNLSGNLSPKKSIVHSSTSGASDSSITDHKQSNPGKEVLNVANREDHKTFSKTGKPGNDVSGKYISGIKVNQKPETSKKQNPKLKPTRQSVTPKSDLTQSFTPDGKEEQQGVEGKNPKNLNKIEEKTESLIAQKADPVAKDSTMLDKSLDSIAEKMEAPQKKKDEVKPSLLLSLRSGTTFGFNQAKAADLKISEKGSFFVQGEASYFLSPKMALTSGLNYESRTENTRRNIMVEESMTNYDTAFVTDSLGNIIDSFPYLVTNTELVMKNIQGSYKLYSVGIPVFFMYSLGIAPQLKLDLSAGAIFSVQGSRIISETYPGSAIVNKFGMKACVRTQLRYQFSAWGVSLNTNFGYDLVPVHSWEGIRRTRTFLDLGVGVHYSF